MRLHMKRNLERSVMDSMYLAQKMQLKDHFFFNEIHSLSEVKKPTLQRILPRFVKRGWIKKFIVSISNEKITERFAYKFIGYPYLEGVGGFTKDNDNRKIAAWGVPEGSKRFWKRSAKELRELRNKFFASEIKRIDLLRSALRSMYYYKYRYKSSS